MKQLSIAQVREILADRRELTVEERSALKSDPRKGVRHLLDVWEKKRRYAQRLVDQYIEMSSYEQMYRTAGKRMIAGVDEAGRGPLAGPVVAAGVVLKPDCIIAGMNDSKQLTAAKRDVLYEQIRENALSVGVGIVSAHEIDRINIYRAAEKAMILAIEAMRPKPDHLLIDAMRLPVGLTQTSLIKGDARSVSIAAASIVAKVTRDRLMYELDRIYPEYGFSRHKGYPTRAHLQAIDKLGPCPEHRMTFAPLKKKSS